MAPMRPSKRRRMYDDSSNNLNTSSFDLPSNKQDKRSLKRSALLANLRSGSNGVRKSHSVKKRRRPSKKLTTDLGGLVEALPDIEGDTEDGGQEWEGFTDANGLRRKQRRRPPAPTGQGQKMVMRSVKSRPGATRRKMAAESKEVERWKRNWAGLVAGTTGSAIRGSSRREVDNLDNGQNESLSERWTKLRGFISGTLEKNKAFS